MFSAFASSQPKQATADVRAFLEGVGPCKKADSDDHIQLRAQVFPKDFTVYFYVRKDTMGCRKVKVERIVHEEKWECGPLLEKIAEAGQE